MGQQWATFYPLLCFAKIKVSAYILLRESRHHRTNTDQISSILARMPSTPKTPVGEELEYITPASQQVVVNPLSEVKAPNIRVTPSSSPTADSRSIEAEWAEASQAQGSTVNPQTNIPTQGSIVNPQTIPTAEEVAADLVSRTSGLGLQGLSPQAVQSTIQASPTLLAANLPSESFVGHTPGFTFPDGLATPVIESPQGATNNPIGGSQSDNPQSPSSSEGSVSYGTPQPAYLKYGPVSTIEKDIIRQLLEMGNPNKYNKFTGSDFKSIEGLDTLAQRKLYFITQSAEKARYEAVTGKTAPMVVIGSQTNPDVEIIRFSWD